MFGGEVVLVSVTFISYQAFDQWVAFYSELFSAPQLVYNLSHVSNQIVGWVYFRLFSGRIANFLVLCQL